MALWGKTDTTASIPKYLTDDEKANAVFVSAEEAALQTNKSKGILGAGWWILKESTGSNGEIRYKTEHLVAMSIANSISGDAADDAKVADVEVAAVITHQPAIDTEFTFNASTLTLVANATVNVGTLTYQWQKKEKTPGARWTNISGATNNMYDVVAPLSAANEGEEYRYILGSTSGAKKITSNPFLLATFDPDL